MYCASTLSCTACSAVGAFGCAPAGAPGWPPFPVFVIARPLRLVAVRRWLTQGECRTRMRPIKAECACFRGLPTLRVRACGAIPRVRDRRRHRPAARLDREGRRDPALPDPRDQQEQPGRVGQEAGDGEQHGAEHGHQAAGADLDRSDPSARTMCRRGGTASCRPARVRIAMPSGGSCDQGNKALKKPNTPATRPKCGNFRHGKG